MKSKYAAHFFPIHSIHRRSLYPHLDFLACFSDYKIYGLKLLAEGLRVN